jgi:dolichyl-phosphate-mannose--protein O-mannosyl transferase
VIPEIANKCRSFSEFVHLCFYIALRLSPAICSTLIAPLFTSALLLSGCPTGPSFLGSFLMSTEFISILQGRMVLTDRILYFFVALMISFVALVER